MRTIFFLLAALPLVLSVSISFIEKGSMPFGGRSILTTIATDSKIYIMGGLTSDPTESNYFGSNEVYSYDPVNNVFTQLANFTLPRYGICTATDGQKIWAFGGYEENGQTHHYGTYDIASNEWQFGLLDHYVYYCSATYIAATQKVLVVFGRMPLSLYDPATDQFEDLRQYYGGDDYGAGSVFYNNLLWAGGLTNDPTRLVTITPNGTVWTEKASNPKGAVFANMVRVGDVFLTFGGSTDAGEGAVGSATINMYNTTSDEWTTLPTQLPMNYTAIAAVGLGPSIYLFGGSYWDNDVFIFSDKYWVIPCINPSECSNGCDEQTGVCLPAPPAAPVAAPLYEPLAPPNSAPVTQSPVAAPSKAPQGKSSTAIANSASLVLLASLLSLM